MRKLLFTSLAALLAVYNASAQQSVQTSSHPDATDGLACFENLSTPDYPKSALRSNVDGSVWAWAQVSPQGTVEKVDTEVVSAWSEAQKLLVPAVEKAIRAAKIKPNCAGRKVWVVFRYELHGQATPDPKVTSRTDPPNIMWIESQPAAASGANPGL